MIGGGIFWLTVSLAVVVGYCFGRAHAADIDARKAIARYNAEIQNIDKETRRLLAELAKRG